MKASHALACIAMLFAVANGVVAQALYVVPRDPAPPTEPARSLVLDPRSAADARAKSTPVYVETIVVEGRRDPDAPRRKALEVRFAEALAARPNPLAGRTPFSDGPCMSLPSTWNDLGDAHVPLSGCPR